MLGSVPTAPSWHGLWLRLIEDTTPARGALASALATRMAAPIARDPPQPLPPQTAQNTLKDLEAKTFQREEPPTKPMVDNIFDFTLARQALEKLTDTTPRVAYNINAEPQERKHAMTTADGFKSHAVFAITDIFEAKVPISSGNERDDFQFDSIDDMMAYEACPDVLDPLFPDWSDKAAIELYYHRRRSSRKALVTTSSSQRTQTTGTRTSPSKTLLSYASAPRTPRQTTTSTSTTSLHGTAAPTRLHVVHPTVTHP